MADPHVQAVIDYQKRLANELTTNTRFNATQLQQVRDQWDTTAGSKGLIQSAFDQATATADKNSPVWKQKGLDSLDNYTQYWYDSMRNPADFTYKDPNATTPQQTATDLTNTATDDTTKLVNDVNNGVNGVTSLINGPKIADPSKGIGVDATGNPMPGYTLPTGGATPTGGTPAPTTTPDPTGGLAGTVTSLIGDLTDKFTTAQTSLLQGMQDAQATQAKSMQDLVTSMLSVGQSVKQPNYASALARNKQLNSGGLGSTMLTGPTGVAPGSMTLGYTSLLGGGSGATL